MADKKPKPKKPKDYAKLSQKQKFIAAAKAAETDESGESFIRAFARVVPSKATGKGRPKRPQDGE